MYTHIHNVCIYHNTPKCPVYPKGVGRSRKGFEHKKFFNSTHVNYRSIPELTFCYKWTCCACTLF